MGFFKKLLSEAADSIKKSVEERKQELQKSVEDRKREALAKIGLKPIDSNNNCNIDRNDSYIDDDEPQTFSVILAEVGAAKLQVVKAVKMACDSGMKEAKDLVDGAPSILKEGLSKVEAEKLKKALEAVGATINLRTDNSSTDEETAKNYQEDEHDETEIISDDKTMEDDNNPEVEEECKPEIQSTPSVSGGLFSERLEAMIAAALQDGVLTDKERELLKRRVEKEGEDWEEVEMIIKARLTERRPVVSSSPSPKVVKEEKRKAEKVLENQYYQTTEEDREATSIIIPEGVTVIPHFCFNKYKNLKSITLPTTIEKIGEGAFMDCDSLESIIIPEGVAVIPANCFWECKNLKSITLPTTIEKIEEDAFSGCDSLESVIIPEGFAVIPAKCFGGCKNLKSITLPTTIEKIGEGAFKSCDSLESIIIPEGVAVIPAKCFYGCKNLKSITLPTTIEKIGEGAFKSCDSLESIIIPEGVAVIPAKCFWECKNLKSITLPTTIEKIGEGAFMDCDSLESIIMPEGVTSIGECAFAKCTNLRSIKLPTTIEKIGPSAFALCKILSLTISNGCERLEELPTNRSVKIVFLPPTFCALNKTDARIIYCFAPHLETLERLEQKYVYVLPQYFDSYKALVDAEELDIYLKVMPEEYLYYYDN